MAYRKEDFEDMAEQAVDQFVSAKTPLNASLLKLAQEHDLNPEQVKRLVETANVKAFLKVFQTPENKGQNVDFDVADSGAIMQDYYSPCAKAAVGDASPRGITITKTTVTMSKVASTVGSSAESYDFFSDLEDMTRKSRRPGDYEALPGGDLFEKEAAESAGLSLPETYVLERKLRAVSDDLMTKIYDAEYTYQDGIDKLASEFAKLYGPDYAVFEKEALAVYGDDVSIVLGDIRTCLRWEKPMAELEKTASARPTVVNTKTAEFKIMDQLVQCKQDQVKYASAIKLARQKLKGLKK